MKRKICVVTGTRAEYGLLRPVLEKLNRENSFDLKIIVTGTHLSESFGFTRTEIEKDGFEIEAKLNILSEIDSNLGVAESVGNGISKLSKIFNAINPDILLLLGDRFEIFAAATAALLCNIPVAHIHGGETTQGMMDEAFRHSITKMSHLHFVSTHDYRRRVIQLGESPDRVFLVGALGVENALRAKLSSKKSLEVELKMKFSKKNILVTFHPVTLENNTFRIQTLELLNALSNLKDSTIIFTYSNADHGGRVINSLIEQYVSNHARSYAFASLGQEKYFSMISNVDVVVGNSSSGLIEVPSFKIPTVNIGERQLGRVRAQSVIECEPYKEDISNALKVAFSPEFRKVVENVENPYEHQGTSDKIVKVLREVVLNDIRKKRFYDLILP